jgi:hypothetical protein
VLKKESAIVKTQAFDVTDQLQHIVDKIGRGSTLHITEKEDLVAKFGDPCPGITKALCVRYRMRKKQAEVKIELGSNGTTLERPLMLVMKKKPPCVSISHATFGHKTNKKRFYDATERLQGIMDQQPNGSWFEFKREVDVLDFFNDPCPGVQKQLILDYEVTHTRETVIIEAPHGKLDDPLDIAGPVALPSLVIIDASFGNPRHEKERVNVTEQLQAILNDEGFGASLKIGADEDLEELLGLSGPPCESFPRHLIISYYSKGKHMRVSAPVREPSKENRKADGKHLDKDLEIVSILPQPAIVIHRAVYGPEHDTSLNLDITAKVQQMVNDCKGVELHLKKGQDVISIFGQAGARCQPSQRLGQAFPSGAFDKLIIQYEVLASKGRICVDEHDRHLWSSIMVGIPPPNYLTENFKSGKGKKGRARTISDIRKSITTTAGALPVGDKSEFKEGAIVVGETNGEKKAEGSDTATGDK